MTDSTSRIGRDEFTTYLTEYRDAILVDIGVQGTEHRRRGGVDAPKLRRMPITTTGAHSRIHQGVGHDRILQDVTQYSGENELASDEDVNFITVRETTGYAAIDSSATMSIAWTTPPTPREVRVAEYLIDFDIDHHATESAPSYVERDIIEQLFPHKQGPNDWLWVAVDDAPVDYVQAIEACVCGLTLTPKDSYYGAVTHRDGESWADFVYEVPGTLRVERHRDAAGEIQRTVYLTGASGEQTELKNATQNAIGKVTDETTVVGATDNDTLDTDVFVIPEAPRPSDVIDVAPTEPAE
ncbi:hypothetical protein [Halosegnis longus]|uniref:hypothetical protein n=1 Tax=Halosegnis longus TaxID=2216012 RepID=UPI00129DA3B9|nr:hypothetical protein [Halosegnis longus]